MEQNDPSFDDKLREMLENPPPDLPTESAIQAMYERLESSAPFGVWSYLAWPRVLWLSLLLLPFMFGYFYLFHQVKTANQRIYDLELLLNNTSTLSDTLNHYQTVYHYDTVYRVVYMQEQRRQAPSFNLPFKSAQSINRLGYIPETKLGVQPRPDGMNISGPLAVQMFSVVKRDPLGEILKAGPNSINMKEDYSRGSSAIQPLPFNTPQLLSDKIPPDTAFALREIGKLPKIKKGLQLNEVLYPLRPHGIRLAVQTNPLAVLQSNGRNGFGMGLRAGITYGKQWQILLGGDWVKLAFEEKDPLAIENYPSGNPRNSEDLLKEVYATLNYMEWTAGLQHNWTISDKWSLYFGASALFRQALSRNLKYEYISNFEEYSSDAALGSSDLGFAGLRLNSGVEYGLGRSWRINGGAYYSLDVTDNVVDEFIELDQYGLRVGLNYYLHNK